MPALYAALLLTLLPAQPPHQLLRVDWSHAVPADPQIAALRGEYAAAVNSGDATRTASLYAPDALSVLCDGTLVRGGAALSERIGDKTLTHATVTLTPRRFSSGPTVASETGTFTETLVGADGRTSVDGVYVTIYSRHPGGPWRIALEVRTTGHAPALAIW